MRLSNSDFRPVRSGYSLVAPLPVASLTVAPLNPHRCDQTSLVLSVTLNGQL